MEKHRDLKDLISNMPMVMDVYWNMVGRKQIWREHYNLAGLEKCISHTVSDVMEYKANAPTGKRIFMFAALHYWIEQTVAMGMALAGLGHQVSFGYLPYSGWQKEVSEFELRKRILYTQEILKPANKVMQIIPMIDVKCGPVTPVLENIAHEIAIFDSQYTLQIEEISTDNSLYKLRYERSLLTARRFYNWLQTNQPDLVIVPNGTVHELAVLYRVAKMMGIDTVTFEFGDQKERIWMAQNHEIMRQNTDALWHELGGGEITSEHRETLVKMYAARKNARIWRNFARKWQEIPTEGARRLHSSLALDARPVVLLATNVLGDSLTLGRQIITQTMAEWIKRTINLLYERKDIQLVIRIHPGEILTRGTSMVELIRAAFPELPDHIKLIGPDEKVNTYDLIEIADVGLVYTTTVGLEMAMAGIPVIVSGITHYRNRGFTHDPNTWEEYVEEIEAILVDHKRYRLSEERVELAWRYAYLFFFEFPFIFPWHLVYFRSDIQERSMSYVLSNEGQQKYGETFRYLAGEPITYRFRR